MMLAPMLRQGVQIFVRLQPPATTGNIPRNGFISSYFKLAEQDFVWMRYPISIHVQNQILPSGELRIDSI